MAIHGKYGIYSRRARRRHDSEEENIHIDLNRETKDVIKELLQMMIQPSSKNKTLNYLNCFVRMCDGLKPDDLSLKDIFLCLQVPLFHEVSELRAASLRAMRHLISSLGIQAAQTFYDLQLPLLICRSLDVVLENRLERVHALRLIRKLISVDGRNLPLALVRSLVAIALDGTTEKDLMVFSSLAALCELGVINPEIFISTGGLNAVLRNVLESHQPQLTEALLGLVLSLLNDPKTRDLMKGPAILEQLVAPLTDCHYRFSADTAEHNLSDDRETRLTASQMALVTLLRSWPGLVSLCHPGTSCLGSIINMLCLPYSDIRKHILDIFYDLFFFPVPDWTDSFQKALHCVDPSSKQVSWQIYEGFVAAEGKFLLQPIAKYRPNLVNNYFALVLLTLIQAGILEGLVGVIAGTDVFLSVRATILLGELLHLCCKLLPPESNHFSNCLPSLIAAATDTSLIATQRKQASDAITCLHHHHELKIRDPPPHSLFLSQQMYFCAKRGKYSHLKSLLATNRKITEESINQSIRDSQVLSKDYPEWDWELIASILKAWECEKKHEDVLQRNFIRKLLNFYKPTSRQFSTLEAEKPENIPASQVGTLFVDFLLQYEESKLAEEWICDVAICLSQVASGSDDGSAPLEALLGPTRLLGTLSPLYFLYLGRWLSSSHGYRMLDHAGIIQYLHDLLDRSGHTVYAKLTLSSLNYTQDGVARVLLSKVLTSSNESSRAYATSFLLVLLRLGIPDFSKWAIELLITQLYDSNQTVSNTAAAILDEACDNQANLEAMISLRPSLLHLGLKGFLLLLRFLSLPSGYRFLRDANFLSHELQKWKQVTNLKYVKIVECALYESLTFHKRHEDGNYGRRSSSRLAVQNLFLPPHMYGQLAQHKDGIDLLIQEQCIPPLITDLHQTEDVFSLKASLWALGHIGMSSLGLPLVSEHIPTILQIALNSPVLSIRGTCYYVLGLLSSTPEGAEILSRHGWSTVKRSHHQKCTIAKNHLNVESFENGIVSRRSRCGFSFSSTESDWPYPCGSISSAYSYPIKFSSESPDAPSLIISHERTHSVPPKQETSPPSSENWQWELLPPTKDRSSSYGGNEEKASDVRRRSISDLEVSSALISEHFGRTSSEKSHSVTNSSDSLESGYPKYEDSERESFSTTHLSKSASKSQRPKGSLFHRASSYVPPTTSFTPDSLTSTRDIEGYLTLRDIQRKRVQSLCFQESEPSVDVNAQEDKHQFTMTISSSDPTPPSMFKLPPEEEETSIEHYMGLCVPSDPLILFSLPLPLREEALSPKNLVTDSKITEPIWKPHTDSGHLLALTDSHTGLILHKPKSCLLCVWSSPSESSFQEITSDLRAQRREVIRLVTNLSSSVGVKSAEQGLLCLKQQAPDVFQDICLYSEVSLHMATFRFRLKARRFIQELFLDLSFQKLIDLASKTFPIPDRQES